MSSKIPSELLVPRANNGLIDTYPDMNYGLGALEKDLYDRRNCRSYIWFARWGSSW